MILWMWCVTSVAIWRNSDGIVRNATLKKKLYSLRTDTFAYFTQLFSLQDMVLLLFASFHFLSAFCFKSSFMCEIMWAIDDGRLTWQYYKMAFCELTLHCHKKKKKTAFLQNFFIFLFLSCYVLFVFACVASYFMQITDEWDGKINIQIKN